MRKQDMNLVYIYAVERISCEYDLIPGIVLYAFLERNIMDIVQDMCKDRSVNLNSLIGIIAEQLSDKLTDKVYSIKDKYTYNGENVALIVCKKLLNAINRIIKEEDISFGDACLTLYTTVAYHRLVDVENKYFLESDEKIFTDLKRELTI